MTLTDSVREGNIKKKMLTAMKQQIAFPSDL